MSNQQSPQEILESKIELLNRIGTDKLIVQITEQENTLEALQKEDALFRSSNVRYLSGYGEDCTEVKGLLADLALEVPCNADGKKATIAQAESWLRQQRKENPALAEAIRQQNAITFQTETNRVNVEMAKKRLESLKAVLGLRTAQIEFLK